MTKNQELAVISKAAAELGEDSYLGPWLEELASELERDLRSDIIPTTSLADARRQAEGIVAEARVTADGIIASARAEAEAQYKRIATARADTAAVLFRISREAELLGNRFQ